MRIEAYTGSGWRSNRSAVRGLFVNQASNVRVDGARREVTLSALFDWYGKDFGSPVEAVLRFIGKYRTDGTLLRDGKWKVSYFAYD